MTISERIKLIRGSLSQSDFGAQIGVSQSAIQNYESGQIPKGDVLQRIRQELNVNIDWLLTGEGNPYIKREGREFFNPGKIELQDGEVPLGKIRECDVEKDRLIGMEFKPKEGQAHDLFNVDINSLQEIFNLEDSIVIPAIQAIIHISQLSNHHKRQNAHQARQIKALEDECDEFKKRLEDLEKKLEDTPGHGHKEEPIKQKAI